MTTEPNDKEANELPATKLWCAACGTWGNHQSGTCPTITHYTTTEPNTTTIVGTVKMSTAEHSRLIGEISKLKEELAVAEVKFKLLKEAYIMIFKD